MMRLTAFASAFLVLLLVTMVAFPARPHPDFTTALFAITGVSLFSAVFAYLILQQRNRHRMAKQALIEIERVLGFYDQDLYILGKTLYPEELAIGMVERSKRDDLFGRAGDVNRAGDRRRSLRP